MQGLFEMDEHGNDVLVSGEFKGSSKEYSSIDITVTNKMGKGER